MRELLSLPPLTVSMCELATVSVRSVGVSGGVCAKICMGMRIRVSGHTGSVCV